MLQPVQSLLSSTVESMALLLGAIIMCFWQSWQLSLLAATTLLPATYITQRYAYWSSTLNRHIAAALGEANGAATEALGNVRTVRLLSTERFESEKYEERTRKALQCGVRDACGGALAYALTNYLDLFTGVLILWCVNQATRRDFWQASTCSRVSFFLLQCSLTHRTYTPSNRWHSSHFQYTVLPTHSLCRYGGNLALEHQAKGIEHGLTAGRLVTFQLYWGMFNSSFKSLQNTVASFTRAAGSALRVLSLVDSVPDIGDGAPPPPPGTVLKGRIDFEEVRPGLDRMFLIHQRLSSSPCV